MINILYELNDLSVRLPDQSALHSFLHFENADVWSERKRRYTQRRLM